MSGWNAWSKVVGFLQRLEAESRKHAALWMRLIVLLQNMYTMTMATDALRFSMQVPRIRVRLMTSCT